MIHSQGVFNGDPSLAKILSDRRKQTIGGDYGVAFNQEDGTTFNEVADGEGYRVGQYSYIDSEGVKKTVKYEAGPEIGFRIISADNVPNPIPVPASHRRPDIEAEQQRRRLAAPRQQPQPVFEEPQPQSFGPPQPFSFTIETGANVNQRVAPQPPRQQVRPQQPRRQQVRPQPRPQQFIPQDVPQNFQPERINPTTIQQGAPIFTTTTTTKAPRFFPPGQLSLNVNEKGYVYSFES